MSAPELDDATIAAWWHRNSAAQGLPDEITDPATIARLVVLAFAGTDTGGGGPTSTRRRIETQPRPSIPARRQRKGSAAARHGGGPRGSG